MGLVLSQRLVHPGQLREALRADLDAPVRQVHEVFCAVFGNERSRKDYLARRVECISQVVAEREVSDVHRELVNQEQRCDKMPHAWLDKRAALRTVDDRVLKFPLFEHWRKRVLEIDGSNAVPGRAVRDAGAVQFGAQAREVGLQITGADEYRENVVTPREMDADIPRKNRRTGARRVVDDEQDVFPSGIETLGVSGGGGLRQRERTTPFAEAMSGVMKQEIHGADIGVAGSIVRRIEEAGGFKPHPFSHEHVVRCRL